MTCNIKSFVYIFKKTNNKKSYNYPAIANKEINYKTFEISSISFKKTFENKNTSIIFDYYNEFSLKFYHKNTNIHSNSIKALREKWNDYVCEKMTNREYNDFFFIMHNNA